MDNTNFSRFRFNGELTLYTHEGIFPPGQMSMGVIQSDNDNSLQTKTGWVSSETKHKYFFSLHRIVIQDIAHNWNSTVQGSFDSLRFQRYNSEQCEYPNGEEAPW